MKHISEMSQASAANILNGRLPFSPGYRLSTLRKTSRVLFLSTSAAGDELQAGVPPSQINIPCIFNSLEDYAFLSRLFFLCTL